jgi:hypothetical protein
MEWVFGGHVLFAQFDDHPTGEVIAVAARMDEVRARLGNPEGRAFAGEDFGFPAVAAQKPQTPAGYRRYQWLADAFTVGYG